MRAGRTIMRAQFRSRSLLFTLAVVIGTAMLTAPGPAAATSLPKDAVPLTVGSGRGGGASGTFEQPNEVDWFKVTLRRGQDYAFWGTYEGDTIGSYFPTVT